MILSMLSLSSTRALAASETPVDIPPNLDPAIAKGLAFLAKQQSPDGSFENAGSYKHAVTALTLMSFLASGHTPDVGKYGLVVRNAVDFLVKSAPPDGYFGRLDGSRMYGHGMVTLALAEDAGVELDPARRKAVRAELAKAVKVILVAQAVGKPEPFAGGWRYEPQSGDSDLSLSGWSALALRASQNVGMDVPKEAVAKAVGFVLKCYHKDAKGFAYQPGGAPTNGLTGVGVLNLCLLDAAERPEVEAGAKFLAANPVVEASQFRYYYLYYATQAAFQVGEPTWTTVWKNANELLLKTQMPDGGWPPAPPHETGRVYASAMSILTLSVPYRLLPIYQR
jgi:hypothetical protein